MDRDHHTIESGIVKDALLAIAESKKPGLYMGGGLALQLDLPEKYHRPTTDIDFSSREFMAYKNFRALLKGAFSPLVEAGYSLHFKKARNTLDAYLSRDENRLMVQIPNRSKNNHGKRQDILDREFAHTRVKTLPRGEVDIISLEDLATHKVIRSLAFTKEYGLDKPRQEDLGALMQEMDALKEDLELSLMGLEPKEVAKKVARIRLYADVFDIKAIQRLLADQFDEKYLAEALKSFERGTIKEKLDFFFSLA